MFKVLSIFLSAFLYLSLAGRVAAATIDLNSSSNWHLRIDGATGVDRLGQYTVKSVDLNGNGKSDVIIAAAGTDYNSRSASGAVYIFYDSLLDDYLTTGNIIDLINSASFNIRIEGPATNGGIKVAEVADMNNDDVLDIVIGGELIDHNGRSNSGSVYILYSSIFSGLTGTGNSIDLASSTSYNVRIDGAVAGDRLGTHIGLGDIDSNGVSDLAISSYTRNSSEGSIYLLKDSLIDDYAGTGNTLDLSTTSNFNVRWDGGTTGILLGLGSSPAFGDFNGDDKQDIVFSANYADHNSRANSGSTWVIFNTLIDDYLGTGNIVSLGTSTNYSVRLDGSATEKYLNHNLAGPIGENGEDNLFLNEYGSTGPSFIVGNSILAQFVGTTGNNLDLSDTNNYNLAITSGVDDYPFIARLNDFTNDTRNDVVVAASSASFNSRANSGSFYLLSGAELLSSLNSTGNSLTLSTEADYVYRVDGAVAGDFMPYLFGSGDFNNDGMIDMLTASQDSDYNSRNNAGSAWLIYSFPHSISPANSTVTTTDTTPLLSGSVGATNSITTIGGVEYQIDNNSVLGSWVSCDASDGAFDETSEEYSCTLSALSEGSHTIYFRAADSNSIYTSSANYGQVALTVDLSGPSYSSIVISKTNNAATITYLTNESASAQLEWGTSTSYGASTTESDTSPRVTSHSISLSGLEPCTTYHFRLLGSDGLLNQGQSADQSFETNGCAGGSSDSYTPQIAQGDTGGGGGGVFTPTVDSYTGGQFATVIVEPGTLTYNAFFSVQLSAPLYTNGILQNPLAATFSSSAGLFRTNVIQAGGSPDGTGGILGIKQSCGIMWQVGGIQQMWFKAYPPKGSDKPAAIIIPELQSKPSIIALGYKQTDLIPPGRPGTMFKASRLKLAHSLDGAMWRILPTSVVDTWSRTVAALHRVGGFYMIVAGCEGVRSN